MLVSINICINMRLYLWDSSDPQHTSCRLPYLFDPVVLLLYQPGKVTHVAQQCPPHSNNLGGIETENWASGKCPPSSKTLEAITLISVVKLFYSILFYIRLAIHCDLKILFTQHYQLYLPKYYYIYSSLHKFTLLLNNRTFYNL